MALPAQRRETPIQFDLDLGPGGKELLGLQRCIRRGKPMPRCEVGKTESKPVTACWPALQGGWPGLCHIPSQS